MAAGASPAHIAGIMERTGSKQGLNRLLLIGRLPLAGGLLFEKLVNGRYIQFIAGFMIGMSLAFMITGFVTQRCDLSR